MISNMVNIILITLKNGTRSPLFLSLKKAYRLIIIVNINMIISVLYIDFTPFFQISVNCGIG